MKNDDWWWIDYIEGELEPTTVPDVEFLLDKSKSDREEHETWCLLKSWVKEVDPIGKKEIWSKSDLAELKDEVMKGLGSQVDAQSLQVGTRVL